MTTKQAKPTDFPWVSPYIIVQDVVAAMEFYHKAFNFKPREQTPNEEGVIDHGEMTYKDQILMFGRQGAFGGTTKAPVASNIESPMNLYAYCEDVDAFYHHAVANGAKSLMEPEETSWGDRMCRLQDPNGYVWAFATNVKDCAETK